MVESPRSSSRLERVCDSFRLSAVIRDQEVECRRLPVAAGQRSLRRSTGPLRNLTLVGFVVSRALVHKAHAVAVRATPTPQPNDCTRTL